MWTVVNEFTYTLPDMSASVKFAAECPFLAESFQVLPELGIDVRPIFNNIYPKSVFKIRTMGLRARRNADLPARLRCFAG